MIRKDDEVVYGDAGYLGIQKRPEITSDAHLSSIDYRMNRRPGKLPHISDNAIDWVRTANPRRAVRWNMRFELLSASSVIKRRRIVG